MSLVTIRYPKLSHTSLWITSDGPYILFEPHLELAQVRKYKVLYTSSVAILLIAWITLYSQSQMRAYSDWITKAELESEYEKRKERRKKDRNDRKP